jgi:hypothetical protein
MKKKYKGNKFPVSKLVIDLEGRERKHEKN